MQSNKYLNPAQINDNLYEQKCERKDAYDLENRRECKVLLGQM